MRPAILTPTKIEFLRPMVFLSSRFSNLANLEYALRLTLMDDNNRQLNGIDIDFIKQIIQPQLLEGIRIGDRLFEFLGSSSSQMKESGIIFYAKDEQNRTAQTIRDLVGNLNDYKRKVAKYIARLGLIFSQSIAFYECDPNIVKIYRSEDLKTNDKEFCFTDGIGIISKSLVRKILPLLRVSPDYFPSAFQIRHGGCKGMLVCYEDDSQDYIVFRESMIKYESEDNSLGILKFSAARPVYLNRPFIQILDQKNVSPEIFYQYFDDATKLITRAILFENDAFFLCKTYHNRNIPYEKYYQARMSFLNEPFFRRILNYLVYFKLNELKTRARIRINPTQGRMAFGVIDETRKLQSGEVFFQYTEMDLFGAPTGKTHILEDEEVMITKFPCLSLGDVRKFKAVNIPGLQHIKDCVVFPIGGERPHTDEMGGSDLDGDEYAICWKSKLIFSGPNDKPTDFTAPLAGDLTRDITLDDIVSFYCDFLLQNNIGQVANCHLMYSDFHPEGLKSPECEELALKYSISLDFQKSGVNAQLEPKYQPNNKWIRPDYMERRGFSEAYLSQKMLGQFYRQCTLIEDVIRMSDEFLLANEMNSDKKMQPSFILDGWRKFEKEASEAFLEYVHRVVEILESMNINSEVALLTNVYEEKTDATPLVFDKLFQYFRAKFALQSENLSEEDLLLLTSAWYAIVFEKCDLLQYQYQNQPLMGMPFLISEHLIKLMEYIKNNPSQSNTKQLSSTIQHPIQEFAKINDPIQFTANLIMYWIKKLNQIFNHRFCELKIYNEQQRCWDKISEKTLLEIFIKTQLKRLMQQCKDEDFREKKKITQLDQPYKIVFYLFNEFMTYLYDLCNTVNNFMINGELLIETFLLRYSLFALSFIDKFDDKIFLVENNDIWDEFNNIQQLMDNVENSLLIIFQSYIDKLFDNFDHNQHRTMRQERFYMLNSNGKSNGSNGGVQNKINLDDLDEDFFRKMKLLCGAIGNLGVFDKDGNLIYNIHKKNGKMFRRIAVNKTIRNYLSTNFLGWNLTRLNIDYYSLNVTGFPSSVSLFRLFLGHPKFFKNIYKLFEIIPEPEKSEEQLNNNDIVVDNNNDGNNGNGGTATGGIGGDYFPTIHDDYCNDIDYI